MCPNPVFPVRFQKGLRGLVGSLSFSTPERLHNKRNVTSVSLLCPYLSRNYSDELQCYLQIEDQLLSILHIIIIYNSYVHKLTPFRNSLLSCVLYCVKISIKMLKREDGYIFQHDIDIKHVSNIKCKWFV